MTSALFHLQHHDWGETLPFTPSIQNHSLVCNLKVFSVHLNDTQHWHEQNRHCKDTPYTALHCVCVRERERETLQEQEWGSSFSFFSTHVTQTQKQEKGITWLQGKEKLKCSRAVVCLCLCIHAVKWQKPDFLRMSSRVQCVWISWRIQWPFPVDTVTVRAVLLAAGIRRIRWESTAALSADRPSVQDLL